MLVDHEDHYRIWQVQLQGRRYRYKAGDVYSRLTEVLDPWSMIIVLAHETRETDPGLCAVAACGEALWPQRGDCPICGDGSELLDLHGPWCLWFWLYRRCAIRTRDDQVDLARRLFLALDRGGLVRAMRAFGDWRAARIQLLQDALGSPRREVSRAGADYSLALADVPLLDYLTGGSNCPPTMPDYLPANIRDDQGGVDV